MTPVSASAKKRLVAPAWAFSTVLLLAAAILTVWDGGALGWLVTFGAVQLAFSSVGAVLSSRRAENPIGWLLLGYGVMAAIAIAGEAYSLRALGPATSSLPGGKEALIASGLIYPPLLFGLVVTLFLLFPDGRLPSPRWRPAARIVTIAGAAFMLLHVFQQGMLNSIDPSQSVVNPYGVSGAAVGVPTAISAVIVLGVAVAAVVSLLRRFRRATGALRQQLEWFGGASALFMVSLAVQSLWWWNIAASWEWAVLALFGAGSAALPIATGIAILRYRLYEIDVIIRKTLVYTTLVGALAVVYLGGVYGAEAVLRTVTGQSGALAVTVSTLAAAAAFQPLRMRIQRGVDHRFYRRKYDAVATLDAFTSHLRDQVDLDVLQADVLDIVVATVHPRHASLWLRGAEARPQVKGG
jgi:hypothetical protein